jgi:C-terminal processing protease CtpA/Prc
MVEALGDGHGYVFHPELTLYGGALGIAVDRIEDAVVVTASVDDRVRIGDQVVSIDGQPARGWMAAREKLASGSPQWKRRRALSALVDGGEGSTVKLALQGADGAQREVTLTRGKRESPVHERPGDAVRTLANGIYYVDLDRAPMSDIEPHIGAMAAAPGVIFDLRGYPNANHDILRHLLTAPDDRKWMFVAKIIYPDRQRQQGWDPHGWHLLPAKPNIGGTVVFLTDERAISYAESVMGYVAGYNLGEIVGGPTAGANGNVNPIRLPGGFRFSFTGMRVLKHDGSRLPGKGFAPTVPCHRTIAGVRAGRDEILEKAVEIIGAAAPR